MKMTRVLASLLCVMMVVCAIPMIQASAATPDGVDFAPTTIFYDNFNDSVISDYTLTGNKTGEIATVDGENKAVKLTTTSGTGLRISNSAFALDGKDVSIRFKLKLGGDSGVTDAAACYYIQPQISLGANQQAKPTIGLSNVSLAKDTWYDILVDFSAATGDNATTGYQTAAVYYRGLEENGTPADWTTVIYSVSEVAASGHSNKIDFWLPTSAKQLATEAWIDDVHVYTQEEVANPDGVNYNPVLVFGENFEDGYAGDYTYTGTKTYEVANGAVKLTSTTANGCGLQINSDEFALDNKNFTLRFKMKFEGEYTEGTGSNKGFYIQPQLAFGTDAYVKGYVGYNNAKCVLTNDTWYEVLYDYAPAASDGLNSVDCYIRTFNEVGGSSAWTLFASLTEAKTTGWTNKLLFWLPGQSGNQKAPAVWLDDIQVYLQENVNTIASPDTDIANPLILFEDNFDDGDASGWTGADVATFEDGTIKLTKPSTITFSNAKFGKVNDKNLTFRFKTKVSGNATSTPDKNWIRPELAFGADQWISTYLGYNSNSTLKQDMWYEFLYDYSPAAADNGYQSATIYYRYSLDKKAWTAWKTATTVTEKEGLGSTNRIRLNFGTADSNQATNVWYDDIKVYLHESSVTPLAVNAEYADKVSASIEKYMDDATLVVTDKEGYEGTVEGLTMFLAEYGTEPTTLESVRKINGTNGTYAVTLPEENFKLFLWDATLSPVFNAISE